MEQLTPVHLQAQNTSKYLKNCYQKFPFRVVTYLWERDIYMNIVILRSLVAVKKWRWSTILDIYSCLALAKPFQKYAQAIATTNSQGKMSKNIKNGLLVAENHYLLSKPRSAAGGFSMVYIVYINCVHELIPHSLAFRFASREVCEFEHEGQRVGK